MLIFVWKKVKIDLNNVQHICNQIEKFEFEELFTVLAKIEEVVKDRTNEVD
ncbi:hypothetical protein SCITRI_001330 [Spiroplasma citri]|nr:hypothetical protein SCITRI_001330 [Spiroplasma citri]